MRAQFGALPVELQGKIVSSCDQLTLYNLNLVDKECNRLATPVLYSNVRLASVKVPGRALPGARSLKPFTWTMLQTPHLARLVKTITFRHEWATGPPTSIDGPGSGLDPWPYHSQRNDILLEKVTPLVRTRREKSEWLDKLIAGHEEAIVALLLPYLVRLRTLDLRPNFGGPCPTLERLFVTAGQTKHTLDGHPILSTITNVMVSGYDGKYPTPTRFFFYAIQLPGLESLFSHRLGDSELAEHHNIVNDIPSRSLSVQNIELRCAKMDHQDLAGILASCKCLKTFIYEVGNTWAWIDMRTEQVRQALASQEKNLENLCLSTEEFGGFNMYSDSADPISFSGFINVTHLKIAPVYVFGPRAIPESFKDARDQPSEQPDSDEQHKIRKAFIGTLPPNLKRLHFTRSRLLFEKDHFFPAFEELFVHHDSLKAVPSLSLVTFEGDFIGKTRLCRRAARVGSMVISRGIEVEYIQSREGTHETMHIDRGFGMSEKIMFERNTHNTIAEVLSIGPTTRSVNDELEEWARMKLWTKDYKTGKMVRKDQDSGDEENGNKVVTRKQLASQIAHATATDQ
ncbi:hypothetical protein EJ05DRAFT_266500 [Pseudovirgaria hyperparasitica]|uniref:F-box domain-containing protein n=1 Tax=Pseudovirgaria hyperparasitica TaxID=470096 RepID=A0A6A6VU50_9PEZI|nr:uncharacterized protein EJ05DRAFT_266500 [Pseudovirgaria hyperparasitica]KAF2752771.1 hypothetical protein EJ05DRAFT_266500 [Pseudovirgaria hyperparasitica]